MASLELLFLDLNPLSCPVNGCRRVADFFLEALPGINTHVQTLNLFPLGATVSSPDLICLRPPIQKSILKTILAIREQWAEVPIVGLFCASGDQQFEVADSLLEGLDDYVTCPFARVDLIPRIRRILQQRNKPRANQASRFQSRLGLETLVGGSKCFLEVVKKVPALAQSTATVLITGETGTGKELVARAIHYRSPRRGKPFIPVNCGALPDSVFESEFFGHVKGAFTDASINEKGLVGEAEGGTLFLDEVDVLSLSAQVKLLRFLQDKEYKAVGSSKKPKSRCKGDRRDQHQPLGPGSSKAIS